MGQSFDFYAPQTFLDEQGRRLLIGWIGMPDDQEQCNPTVNDGWQNALTVPREVFLKDEKVMQYPAEELLSLRKEEQILEPGKTSDKMQYYDIEITMLEDTDLTLVISDGITLCYSRSDKMFTITFLQEQNLGYGRKSRAVYLDECRSVRILADTTCLEVYLNGGEEVFTTRFYTEDGMSSFRAEKGDMEIKYWVMEPMKVKL